MPDKKQKYRHNRKSEKQTQKPNNETNTKQKSHSKHI